MKNADKNLNQEKPTFFKKFFDFITGLFELACLVSIGAVIYGICMHFNIKLDDVMKFGVQAIGAGIIILGLIIFIGGLINSSKDKTGFLVIFCTLIGIICMVVGYFVYNYPTIIQ